MQLRTMSTLEELDAATWFECVGKHDSSNVIVLDSWNDAIASCGSEEWEELCQEAVNQYTTRLAERDNERFQQWNVLVKEIKKTTTPMVDRKIAKVVEINHLSKSFVDTVQWDLLHVCLEAEYADVYPPGFYASQAYWYRKGHFPCGWKGKFPEGKLIVY